MALIRADRRTDEHGRDQRQFSNVIRCYVRYKEYTNIQSHINLPYLSKNNHVPFEDLRFLDSKIEYRRSLYSTQCVTFMCHWNTT
jgi:hypothetical protein